MNRADSGPSEDWCADVDLSAVLVCVRLKYTSEISEIFDFFLSSFSILLLVVCKHHYASLQCLFSQFGFWPVYQRSESHLSVYVVYDYEPPGELMLHLVAQYITWQKLL